MIISTKFIINDILCNLIYFLRSPNNFPVNFFYFPFHRNVNYILLLINCLWDRWDVESSMSPRVDFEFVAPTHCDTNMYNFLLSMYTFHFYVHFPMYKTQLLCTISYFWCAISQIQCTHSSFCVQNHKYKILFLCTKSTFYVQNHCFLCTKYRFQCTNSTFYVQNLLFRYKVIAFYVQNTDFSVQIPIFMYLNIEWISESTKIIESQKLSFSLCSVCLMCLMSCDLFLCFF